MKMEQNRVAFCPYRLRNGNRFVAEGVPPCCGSLSFENDNMLPCMSLNLPLCNAFLSIQEEELQEEEEESLQYNATFFQEGIA